MSKLRTKLKTQRTRNQKLRKEIKRLEQALYDAEAELTKVGVLRGEDARVFVEAMIAAEDKPDAIR